MPKRKTFDERLMEAAKKAGINVVVEEREAVGPGPISEVLFELRPAKFKTEDKKYPGPTVLRFWPDRFQLVTSRNEEVLDVRILREEITGIQKAPILGHAVDLKDGDAVLI